MRYEFDWNPAKARQNFKKHGISFDRAARVFLDPFAISIFDERHSENEDRWVTIGAEANEVLLVVIHIFENIDADVSLVRIISARKATKAEMHQYHERR
jgi:uncharacterized DUF497 family protein